jgi:hypothetical protein
MRFFFWLSRFRPPSASLLTRSSCLRLVRRIIFVSILNELLFAPATSSYRSEVYEWCKDGAGKHCSTTPFPPPACLLQVPRSSWDLSFLPFDNIQESRMGRTFFYLAQCPPYSTSTHPLSPSFRLALHLNSPTHLVMDAQYDE